MQPASHANSCAIIVHHFGSASQKCRAACAQSTKFEPMSNDVGPCSAKFGLESTGLGPTLFRRACVEQRPRARVDDLRLAQRERQDLVVIRVVFVIAGRHELAEHRPDPRRQRRPWTCNRRLGWRGGGGGMERCGNGVAVRWWWRVLAVAVVVGRGASGGAAAHTSSLDLGMSAGTSVKVVEFSPKRIPRIYWPMSGPPTSGQNSGTPWPRSMRQSHRSGRLRAESIRYFHLIQANGQSPRVFHRVCPPPPPVRKRWERLLGHLDRRPRTGVGKSTDRGTNPRAPHRAALGGNRPCRQGAARRISLWPRRASSGPESQPPNDKS